jgi:hypothetical protein
MAEGAEKKGNRGWAASQFYSIRNQSNGTKRTSPQRRRDAEKDKKTRERGDGRGRGEERQ